ncbi:hypothetical protein GpartN1_g99.t1 [Galdieria partita]|uniref:Metallo-beta-lactamase domain-containing protein n=1 Tax=Galdieria partita TaxID=83374 RepID=A0A9C7PPN2_9RHOD|nr:hypothetical protein GpartN1_g99.t1 [Galdieria partita]
MKTNRPSISFATPHFQVRRNLLFCRWCCARHKLQKFLYDNSLLYLKLGSVRHFSFGRRLDIFARSTEEEYTVIEGPAFQKPASKFVNRDFPDIRKLQSWQPDDEVDAFWKEFRDEQLAFRGKSNESDERPQFIEPTSIFRDYEDKEASATFDWINGEWKATGCLQYLEPPSFEAYLEDARNLKDKLEEKITRGSSEEEIRVKLEVLREFISFATREERLCFPPGYWRLVFLGTSSALPTLQRNVSSLALRIRCPFDVGRDSQSNATNSHETTCIPEALFLIDCGEMTSTRLMEAKWHSIYGFRNLKGIFITHLHGDHVWGLPVLMEKIGFYTQQQQRYMRRLKRNATLHIFGPQGLRLLLRTALQNTFLGFWFCVHELIPRDTDFDHVEPWYVPECLLEESQTPATYLPFLDKLPGKHCEEIIGEDVKMNEKEKCWKLYIDELFQVQVFACPIKHRVPCWGYFFKELTQYWSDDFETARKHFAVSYGIHDWNVSLIEDRIDTKYAYALGVRGKQFSMLRNGKPVKVRNRRDPIEFSEVEASMGNFVKRAVFNEFPVFKHKAVPGIHLNRIPRSILILGDTNDPSSFLELAKHCDGLVHEATFLEVLKDKAAESFHSTARMAGQFATLLEARTLILTHFSSRYETNFYKSNGTGLNEDLLKTNRNFQDDNDDDTNSVQLLSAEASDTYSKGPIHLARDYSVFDLPPHSEERKSSLYCCSTRKLDRKHTKCKSNKAPVEFWLQKPMSLNQMRRLKQNVLQYSKESLQSLLSIQQENVSLPVETE